MRTKHIQPFVTLQPSGKFEVCHKCFFQRLHHDTVPQQRELLRLGLSHAQAEGVTWRVGESWHTESLLLPPSCPAAAGLKLLGAKLAQQGVR